MIRLQVIVPEYSPLPAIAVSRLSFKTGCIQYHTADSAAYLVVGYRLAVHCALRKYCLHHTEICRVSCRSSSYCKEVCSYACKRVASLGCKPYGCSVYCVGFKAAAHIWAPFYSASVLLSLCYRCYRCCAKHRGCYPCISAKLITVEAAGNTAVTTPEPARLVGVVAPSTVNQFVPILKCVRLSVA